MCFNFAYQFSNYSPFAYNVNLFQSNACVVELKDAWVNSHKLNMQI